MLKIALTGGIATGKSYVLAELLDRGVPAIDSDDLVHELFEPNTPTTQAIALEFGRAILLASGRVDRAALGAKVFADPAARLRLEAIVHPVVYEKLQAWFASVERPMAVASIPLLYETHREADYDAVVVTACKADQQFDRLIARGLSEAQARLRMAAQIPTEEKALRADYVIWTSGTMQETSAQVDELLIKLARRLEPGA
jgi:dephospho-CoA kinase